MNLEEKRIQRAKEVLLKYTLPDALKPQYDGMTAYEITSLMLRAAELKAADENTVKINEGYKCGECDIVYKNEPRVEAGMKCGRCAYGLTCFNGHKI